MKIRWACDQCGCVNEKRPSFRQVFKYEKLEGKSGWLCTNTDCKHPAKHHSFFIPNFSIKQGPPIAEKNE